MRLNLKPYVLQKEPLSNMTMIKLRFLTYPFYLLVATLSTSQCLRDSKNVFVGDGDGLLSSKQQ